MKRAAPGQLNLLDLAPPPPLGEPVSPLAPYATLNPGPAVPVPAPLHPDRVVDESGSGWLFWGLLHPSGRKVDLVLYYVRHYRPQADEEGHQVRGIDIEHHISAFGLTGDSITAHSTREIFVKLERLMMAKTGRTYAKVTQPVFGPDNPTEADLILLGVPAGSGRGAA